MAPHSRCPNLAPRASFLGLPVELRLRIYQCVVEIDVDHVVLPKITTREGRRHGYRAHFDPNEYTALITQLPWINLKKTCKIIEAELASFMSAKSFLDNRSNREYVLDLDLYSDDRFEFVSATWRKVPCPPNHAQCITINVIDTAKAPLTTPEGSTWNRATFGSPYAAGCRILFQLVNHICHNGPCIIRKHRLSKYMRVQEVAFNLWSTSAPVGSGAPQFDSDEFINALTNVVQQGTFHGYVETVTINSARTCQPVVMQICPRKAYLESAWNMHGFGWGV